MQTRKLKLRNIIAIAICLVGLTVFSGCKKETAVESSIIGKWVTSSPNLNHNDTIHFTSGMRIEDYFVFAHITLYSSNSYYFTYSLTESNIKITSHQPGSAEFSETFEYTINGNSLTIRGFNNPFSLTNEARTDVHFTKVE
ncbi:hypothetical protein [Pedobacter arcticus]|uniref:hypothetical protein n=1 Tax=Pedobacter arcticus TaxID=752140 RepID=UPI00036CC750|nr:hypothetical protein [Pedobacter arcticus]